MKSLLRSTQQKWSFNPQWQCDAAFHHNSSTTCYFLNKSHSRPADFTNISNIVLVFQHSCCERSKCSRENAFLIAFLFRQWKFGRTVSSSETTHQHILLRTSGLWRSRAISLTSQFINPDMCPASGVLLHLSLDARACIIYCVYQVISLGCGQIAASAYRTSAKR